MFLSNLAPPKVKVVEVRRCSHLPLLRLFTVVSCVDKLEDTASKFFPFHHPLGYTEVTMVTFSR
jgi:hypothetical protein